jgi:hypothetical protein
MSIRQPPGPKNELHELSAIHETGLTAMAHQLIGEMIAWERRLTEIARRIERLEEEVRAVVQPAVLPLTVRQIAEKYPAYSLGSLRWALFHRKSNGLDCAVIQKGRRLLLDEVKFLDWVARGHQVSTATPPSCRPERRRSR